MTPEEYVDQLLAGWPPLTEDQLSRLAVLLRGGEAADTQPVDDRALIEQAAAHRPKTVTTARPVASDGPGRSGDTQVGNRPNNGVNLAAPLTGPPASATRCPTAGCRAPSAPPSSPQPNAPAPSPRANNERGSEMAEDEAARALPTCPPTYVQRAGTLVCTTCGAVVGASDADQIRHTTWHTTLAELFALAQGR